MEHGDDILPTSLPTQRRYRGWMKNPYPQAPRTTEQRFQRKRLFDEMDYSDGLEKTKTCTDLNSVLQKNVPDISQDCWSQSPPRSPLSLTDEEEATSSHNEDTEGDIDNQPEVPLVLLEEPIINLEPLFDTSKRNQQENTDSEKPDENQKMPDLEIPIHPNLRTTKFECLLMILTFSLRHGLTSVAVEDMCKLVNQIVQAEVIPTTKFMFNKVFCSGLKYRFHFICSACEAYLGEFEKNTKMACEVCGKEWQMENMNNGNFFISLPIEEQLIFLLENTDDILNHLKYRWKRNVTEDHCIKDIYDGVLYKKLSDQDGILSSPNNFSITFNTDGAVVFDSRKNSLWPIHFRINELPPNIRFNQGNSMVAGIWFGKSEPNMTVFLSAFVKEANKLFETTLQWHGPTGVIQSKVVVLNCVVDSKAKPAVQNIKQFNGYYGCGYCYHPGVVLDEGSNQAKYVMDNEVLLMDDESCIYTVTKADTVYSVEDRKDTTMRIDMNEAEQKRAATGRRSDIKGVKGISPLYALPLFDVVFGIPVDYMHAVLLGVTKLVANLWLDSQSHREDYYIGNKVEMLDRRLVNIKPPSSISRRPRGISERTDWKANEWRSWLLFYCLPCLSDILPMTYLKHHCILVSAIHILLQNNITHEELDSASWYLIEYVLEFQRLYGAQFMHYNVHLLLHLGKCVKLLGPLWCFSAFSFEAANGSLLKLVKSTRAVVSQIAHKYSVCKFIPKAIKMYHVSEDVLEYCDDLMCYRTVSVSSRCGSFTILGPQKVVKFTDDEQTLLELNGYTANCSFERMIKNNCMYHARCYSRRGAKSDDSVVKLSNDTFAVIEKILKHSTGDEEPKIYILVRTINVARNQNVVNHKCGAKASHTKVTLEIVYGNLQLLCADQIEEKAILITTGEKTYVAVFPNSFEKD